MVGLIIGKEHSLEIIAIGNEFGSKNILSIVTTFLYSSLMLFFFLSVFYFLFLILSSYLTFCILFFYTSKSESSLNLDLIFFPSNNVWVSISWVFIESFFFFFAIGSIFYTVFLRLIKEFKRFSIIFNYS